MPGAEFHANVLDGLLSNRAIAPAAPWQRVATMLLPALGGQRRRRTGRALGHGRGALWPRPPR